MSLSTPPSAVVPLDRPDSLREQVRAAVRAMLISGQLAPGRVYSAPTLAAQFGVSPTPVREAMLDLAGEGLVHAVRNKGFRVTELTDAELDALAELRALIEIPVMAAVAADCTGAVAAAVEALVPQARQLVAAADDRDLARYIRLDTEFHLTLLALHGNDYVVEVVRDLRGRSRLFGLAELAERGTLRENAAEHLAILDAARSRDSEAMTRLMRTHIGHLRGLWVGRG